MKKVSLFLVLPILTSHLIGQNNLQEYFSLVKTADSLYNGGDYKNSAFTYSTAFKSIGWKAYANDRYNAACSWALAHYPDSSFFHLNRIVTKELYDDYGHISTDPDLKSLYNDSRWKTLLELVKKNKDKAEIKLNKSLVKQLDSIYTEDQKYRLQINEIEKKYGIKSAEMQVQWKIIKAKDSINLAKVKAILDEYGWLGSDIVGKQGNTTLFLVVQHSDQKTQEKYLPLMREAVKKGKALGSSLALLEDRVALGQGKRQIYGSQITRDIETKLYYVRPLDDPDNVDKRRAEVGLPPLADYVNYWQIKWDLEKYKKNLPAIEAKEKATRK